VYCFSEHSDIYKLYGVHTGDDTVADPRLSAYGLEISWDACGFKFLLILRLTLLFKYPIKLLPGVYTLATLEDIPVAYLPPFDKTNDSYFPRGRDETQYRPMELRFYDFDANKGLWRRVWSGRSTEFILLNRALRTSSYAYGRCFSQGYQIQQWVCIIIQLHRHYSHYIRKKFLMLHTIHL
jgi:hypothetical protein